MKQEQLKRKVMVFILPYYLKDKITTATILESLVCRFEDSEITQDNIREFTNLFKEEWKKERKKS